MLNGKSLERIYDTSSTNHDSSMEYRNLPPKNTPLCLHVPSPEAEFGGGAKWTPPRTSTSNSPRNCQFCTKLGRDFKSLWLWKGYDIFTKTTNSWQNIHSLDSLQWMINFQTYMQFLKFCSLSDVFITLLLRNQTKWGKMSAMWVRNVLVTMFQNGWRYESCQKIYD